MKKTLSYLVIKSCRAYDKVQNYFMTRAYKNIGMQCLMILVMLFCLVQTSTAKTSLDMNLDIKPALWEELVTQEVNLNSDRRPINNRQDYVARLFHELDIAILKDDKYRIHNILHALALELEQLQDSLSEYDMKLEKYRSFIYRLFSSSPRRQPLVVRTQIDTQWQTIFSSIFEEMLAENKATMSPNIKSIIEAEKRLNQINEVYANIPRSPYRNAASLIDKHDNAFLERIYIKTKKEFYALILSAVNNSIELYLDREYQADEFYQDNYGDLRNSIDHILIDPSEEMPAENPYQFKLER